MKLKFGRRDFLKGLLAAGAAALVPQALVEPVHGASDLTPRERDIAADVMGLRRETWAGWDTGLSESIAYPMYEDWPDGTVRLGKVVLPRSMPESEVLNLIRARQVYDDSICARWVGEDDALFVVEPGTTIVGVDSAARPSFSFPRDEMREITAAFVRGSAMAADNLGVTLPRWSLSDDEQTVGRMLLDSFDKYAERAAVDPGGVRHTIQDEWGLLLSGTGSRRRTVGDVIAHRTQTLDNLGLTIDVEHVSYMAALNKGKLVDSLTESEKRQAFMNELLRGDGTDVISDTTPTWGGDRA